MADRAVIFDMDGVLVLSSPAHWIAWCDVAREHGVEMTRERFLSFNGYTNPDICRMLWRGCDAAFVERIAWQKELAYRQAIGAAVPLAPGCRELLAALRGAGVAVAVGSSAPPENVDLVLDGGGIRAQFDAVVHAGMVARGKPAPDIFLRAAGLLGLPPRQCVVVEDAPSGIAAARAAGMPAVGIASNHAADELLRAGARAVVPALCDLQPAALR